MKIPNLTHANTALAIAAVSFISTWSAQGALIPFGTTDPGIVITTIAAPGGTVLSALESPFSNVSDPGISGLLRSIAVQTAGPGSPLDFYYQVVNNSTGTPATNFEIFTFAVIEGYRTELGAIDAFYLTTPTTLGGLPFADVAGTAGKTVNSAYRLPSTDSGGFAFDSDYSTVDPGGAGGATNENIEVGQTSNWLLFRTSLTEFSTGAGFSLAAIGVGTGSADAFALTPIPEPSTVLFGMAMFGVCAGGRFRKKLEAQS